MLQVQEKFPKQTPRGNSGKARVQATTGGILPELKSYSKMIDFDEIRSSTYSCCNS